VPRGCDQVGLAARGDPRALSKAAPALLHCVQRIVPEGRLKKGAVDSTAPRIPP